MEFLESPDSRNVIIIQFFITGQDGDVEELAFRDDQSVKGISVVKGKVGSTAHGFPAKGGEVKSLLFEEVWKIGAVGVIHLQFPD